MQFNVDHRFVHAQLAQYDTIVGWRQTGIAEYDTSPRNVEFNAEASLDQQEEGSARPGLRATSDGRKRGRRGAASAKTAKQFWQAPQFHVARGGEHTLKNLVDVLFETIPG